MAKVIDKIATSQGILSAIGKTPLVRLTRLDGIDHFQLYAKLESANPGGSLKDRPALNIIQQAMLRGDINQETTIIEASSGNFGIGLAQVCTYFGLKFICVLDSRATQQNIQLIRAYGGIVEIVTQPDPISGELLQACLNRVKELCQEFPNSFWPNQHANLDNCASHQQTMAEIADALDGQVDYVYCATSTCGTLRGCAEFIEAQSLSTRVVAVDAEGSLIFSTNQGKRIIPGHGAGKPPGLLRPGLAHRVVYVDARASIHGCRTLLRREAIMAGGSSGGVLSAVLREAHSIPAGSTVVVIICDRGDRYLNTLFSDEWVLAHYPDFFETDAETI